MVDQNKPIYSLISDVGATNSRIQLITYQKGSKRPTQIKSTFLSCERLSHFCRLSRRIP